MSDPAKWARRFGRQHGIVPGAGLKKLWDAAELQGATITQTDVPGESGRTFKAADGWHIWIAARSSFRRTRFTLAHEIGHYLLGAAGTRVANEERWADAFASELLVPEYATRQLVTETVRERPDTSIKTLVTLVADHFAVTEACAVVRMNALTIRRIGCVSFKRLDRGWVLYSTLCLPPAVGVALRSSPNTSATLDTIRANRPEQACVPLMIRGVEHRVPANVTTSKTFVSAYVEIGPLAATVARKLRVTQDGHDRRTSPAS